MQCSFSKNHDKAAVAVSVRRAEDRDDDFLFQLRNERSVRAQSWNTERVDRATHETWFKNALQDSRRVLYVVEADGMPAGQVRFDVDKRNSSAETSIAIAECFRGKGIGSWALRFAGQLLIKDLPTVKKNLAHIKTDNTPSIKTFLKAGYENRGVVDYEGHRCIEMMLTR